MLLCISGCAFQWLNVYFLSTECRNPKCKSHHPSRAEARPQTHPEERFVNVGKPLYFSSSSEKPKPLQLALFHSLAHPERGTECGTLLALHEMQLTL